MLQRGLFAGMLAGLWVAFADYGATWLWLPVPRDRAWLLVRLLASLVPIGAVLGLLGAGAIALAMQGARHLAPKRARWLWPLPLVLVAIVPLSLLAEKLCSGGAISRIAAKQPIVPALRVALPALLYAGLVVLGLVRERVARASEVQIRRGALALLALAFALGKVNQLVLPNLYDYLHALLALGTWAVAALGLALAARAVPQLVRIARPFDGRALAAMTGAALLGVALLNARTLDHNLNVRVAMFDARSPTSRALLRTGDPLLRKLEPPRTPRATEALTRATRDLHGLPQAEGAHVLLITVDALRADHLGSYGYGRPVSPRLDALAKEAVVFERAYAQAPHSSYSLSSLHTSEYVHEVVELGRPLPASTLATALTAHGYHTAAFFTDGIFHTEGAKLSSLRDSAFGFALFDHTNRESEQQTDRVLQEVERIKQRGEPPSLLWVHYFDVHEPYEQTTFGTGEMDRYDSEILHVDREVDRLIRELDARLSRDVVVAITADHGEEFREHGGVYHGSTLYDEQVRVPLILRVPRLEAARVASPVEVVDLAPTLLGAVGAPVPDTMRGRDLRAIAAGRRGGRSEEPVFSAVLTKRMGLRWPHKLIADLRFGLFELYDLEHDPHERHNLAGREPAILSGLRDQVYGWLDSIEAHTSQAPSALTAYERALHLGRLGDRRAVADTCALLLNNEAPTALRIEAGQNLAKLADPAAVPALLEGLRTEPASVAAEAAIALGRMYDARARSALLKLMHTEDPYVRARAAISLGRLRDRAAVPALIDALWVAPTQYEREEAVRWLGRLGDPAAVEPLLSLLPEFGLRYLLPVALGQIGDARAYPALLGMLEWESRTNIRDEIVRGLGLLGDARAIEPLIEVLDREAGLKNTAESLVRLGALERGDLGGLDLAPRTRGAVGFGRCTAGPLVHDWDYLERTYCVTNGRKAQLTLPVPRERGVHAGARLVVRARRLDTSEPVQCAMQLAGETIEPLRADGEFREQRIELAPELLRGAPLALQVSCGPSARVALDHALIVPRTGATASVRSAGAKAPEDPQVVQ